MYALKSFAYKLIHIEKEGCLKVGVWKFALNCTGTAAFSVLYHNIQ
jgi:hypothetical protein